MDLLYSKACEAMARRLLGDEHTAVTLLAGHTRAELAKFPSLSSEHFRALLSEHEPDPIAGYFDPDSGRYVVPPAVDAIKPPPNSVAASELGLSRALGVDIDLVERLWTLGKKGRASARNIADFVNGKTQDWPDEGTPEHLERAEKLWAEWIPRIESTLPPPTRADGETDRQWERTLNTWADSRKYADVPPILLLAEALWESRVRFIAAEDKLPAIVSGLHRDVITVMGRQTEMALGESVMRDSKGREIADIVLVDAAITEQMVRAGAGLFGSLLGNHLLNFLVLEAADRDALAKQGELIRPDDLHIDGGMAGLCGLIGVPAIQRNREILRSILRAGACLHWRNEIMQGTGLWTWIETIGKGRRKGTLMISLAAPLRPGFAAKLSAERKGRSAFRKLVPELRYAPPLQSVRRNERGKVYTLGRTTVGELVAHADQLPAGVLISDSDWRRMADASGLPLELVDRVVEGFVTGDDNAPALLKRVGDVGDRYTLGDAHRAAREHIEDLGERVRKGKTAAAKRKSRKKKAQ